MPKRPKVEKTRGRLEPAPPIKGRIESLFFQRREKFELIYENRRVRLQARLARLLLELKNANIEANLEKTVKETRRKKTGHLQLHITGIKTTGNINWTRVQQIFKTRKLEIENLIGQLQYFAEVARRNNFGLHEFPLDIQKNFEALEYYIVTKGDIILSTGKKKVW